MMMREWYVLRSNPRKEEAAWRQLLARGFEGFYPRLQVQTVNPRASKHKPYFPGYLFVRMSPDELSRSAFHCMPHVIGLLCFDRTPACVPDTLIAAIRRHVESIAAAGGELLYRLRPGDAVVIQHGPFAEYEAVFDTRLDDKDRVRVLLKMLNERYVPLELHVGQIRPV